MTGEQQVTIPQPFSFEQRTKTQKVMKYEQDLASSPKKSFHAKPVPASTHWNLYSEMQRAEQQHKLQLKAKSIVKNERAPKVIETKPQEPSEEEMLSYKFKAKPVPKSVSVPLYGVIKEKEKRRKVFLSLHLCKVPKLSFSKE